MAKELARKIGYVYIDSGAMYRAVTLYCIGQRPFENDTVNESELQKSHKTLCRLHSKSIRERKTRNLFKRRECRK